MTQRTIEGVTSQLSAHSLRRSRLAQGAATKWRWVLAVTLTLGLGTGILQGVHPSADVYWSWASGSWMLQHHQILRHDPFSYALAHSSVTLTEWLFDVVLAVAVQLFGSSGLFVVSLVAFGLSVGALAWYLHSLGATAGRAAWLLGYFVAGGFAFFSQDRALGFSVAFFSLELGVLHRARRQPRWYFVVPVLLALWINVHGSALFGVAVLALEFAWSLVPERAMSLLVDRPTQRRALAGALVASLVALGATPWGYQVAVYDTGLSSSSSISSSIEEWMSPNFHYLGDFVFFLFPLVLLGLGCWRRRLPALEASLVGVLLLSALYAVRFEIYLVVASCALAARAVHPSAERPEQAFFRSWTSWAAGAMVSLLALVLWLAPSAATSPGPGVPVAAINYLEHSPEGRVVTSYTWGAYAMSRGFATYVDDRYDLFTRSGLFQQSEKLFTLSRDPDPVFEHYDVRYVLYPAHSALSVFLSSDPKWRLVFSEKTADLFERVGPGPWLSGRVAGFVSWPG